MATEIKIPIPDQTTEEVRIVKWHKVKGDTVSAGEVILEVETDKSVIEVEAVAAGEMLAVLYEVDDMVPVGQVVGAIGQVGEVYDAPNTAREVGVQEHVPPTTSSDGQLSKAAAVSAKAAEKPAVVPSGVKASPIARNVAGRLGVDLTLVRGTGPGGRITRDDVERFAANPIPAAVSGGAAVLPVVAKMIDGRIMASPNAKRLAKKTER